MQSHRASVVLMTLAGLFLAPVAVEAQAQQVDLPVSAGQRLRITISDGRTIVLADVWKIPRSASGIPARQQQLRVLHRNSGSDCWHWYCDSHLPVASHDYK